MHTLQTLHTTKTRGLVSVSLLPPLMAGAQFIEQTFVDPDQIDRVLEKKEEDFHKPKMSACLF